MFKIPANNFHSDVDMFRSLAKHSTPFRALNQGNRIYGSGSYIQYKDKFYILTNRHICLAGQHINKNKTHIQIDEQVARIVKISYDGDLCLLESNRKSGLLISNTAPVPMDHVTIIGFPRGIGKVIRSGRIINTKDIYMSNYSGYATVSATQISATAYPGNSGSPALNSNGHIIGVLFAGNSSYPQEPFIVPYNKLISFLSSIDDPIKKPATAKKKHVPKKRKKTSKPKGIIVPLN